MSLSDFRSSRGKRACSATTNAAPLAPVECPWNARTFSPVWTSHAISVRQALPTICVRSGLNAIGKKEIAFSNVTVNGALDDVSVFDYRLMPIFRKRFAETGIPPMRFRDRVEAADQPCWPIRLESVSRLYVPQTRGLYALNLHEP